MLNTENKVAYIYIGNSNTPVELSKALADSIDENKFKDVVINKSNSTSDVLIDNSTVNVSKVKYTSTEEENDNSEFYSSMNALRDGAHTDEINALVQYVQDQAATMWT